MSHYCSWAILSILWILSNCIEIGFPREWLNEIFFYCGSNQSPFRVGKIIFWKYFWEVIYIRATAGIKQFCLFSERSTIALKSNFLRNGWMKFFQMWLISKVFWHKKKWSFEPMVEKSFPFEPQLNLQVLLNYSKILKNAHFEDHWNPL